MIETTRPNPSHGLSIDVEDYYHVEAFADRIAPDTWSRYSARVVQNTRRILELLDQAGAKATFFILGWVAEREPGLLLEIASAGHELGCHSYLHQCVWRLTPERFREDTRKAVASIENVTGRKVTGYRAPTFSILERSLWALEILAEEGFLYDSSVFPVRHDLYGIPQAPRFAFRWECRGNRSIYEIPPSTVRLLGYNLPAAGGGYLRILPMAYTRWALKRIAREGESAIIYFHPWEIDRDQPRLPGRMKSVFRQYCNLGRMERNLVELFKGANFITLHDYMMTRRLEHAVPVRPVEFGSQSAALLGKLDRVLNTAQRLARLERARTSTVVPDLQHAARNELRGRLDAEVSTLL